MWEFIFKKYQIILGFKKDKPDNYQPIILREYCESLSWKYIKLFLFFKENDFDFFQPIILREFCEVYLENISNYSCFLKKMILITFNQ